MLWDFREPQSDSNHQRHSFGQCQAPHCHVSAFCRTFSASYGRALSTVNRIGWTNRQHSLYQSSLMHNTSAEWGLLHRSATLTWSVGHLIRWILPPLTVLYALLKTYCTPEGTRCSGKLKQTVCNAINAIPPAAWVTEAQEVKRRVNAARDQNCGHFEHLRWRLPLTFDSTELRNQ